MKILVVIRNSPAHSYLFAITSQDAADEIHGHVREGRHSKAIDTVFRRGIFEREVAKSQVAGTRARLILCDNNARWDLTN